MITTNTAARVQQTAGAANPSIGHAPSARLPARGLNVGAAVLSFVLTSLVLGAVVIGMDSMGDRRAQMSATQTSATLG